MMTTGKGITVIDLFCGGGGFSEGFHQAGFDVVFGIDNWKPACKTHEVNGLGETSNMDLLDVGVDDVLKVKKYLEEKFGTIDIVIGSPPCTEFSFAKKGGRGDIEKGMVLVRKHLLFVSLFKPKYWLMENVPHLEEALKKECDGSKEKGWRINYEKLGIPKKRFKELGIKDDELFIPESEVFTASDFGTCENRKRFIAGNYPLDLVLGQKVSRGTDVSLGGLLNRLEQNIKKSRKSGYITDPNYSHHRIKNDELKDYHYDTSLHPLYLEEMRHLKRRHIQYGRMELPENLDAPARTIMATYNPSSREAMIFETEKTALYQGIKRRLYRQPTVREVACIQGFPIVFQLASSRINNRYKLIGNAVPCQLSNALAKAISTDIENNLSNIKDDAFLARCKVTFSRQKRNKNRPIISKPKYYEDEAVDIKEVNNIFRANEHKRIRRIFPSASYYGDSSQVIFENSEILDGKIRGGIHWKSCMQRGTGKQFYQVFLDHVSIEYLLKAMNNSVHGDELKDVLSQLLNEIDKGIPIVNEEWVEFPGWHNNIKGHLSKITQKRLRLPSLIELQDMFTHDLSEVEDIISPIDLFDGLDAIMLKVFTTKKFMHLIDYELFINKLRDKNSYTHRIDHRIVPFLTDVNIPLVTTFAGLSSIYILFKMYERTPKLNNDDYFISLQKAKQNIINWTKREEVNLLNS